MSVDQTQPGYLAEESKPRRAAFPAIRIGRTIWIGVALALTLMLAGGGAIPASEARARSYAMTVAGWGFDLAAWEVDALAEKASASFAKPADEYPPRLASLLVREYMERAKEIGLIEENLTRLYIEDACGCSAPIWALQVRSSELRAEQFEARPAVEQVIQRQIGSVLELAGLTVWGRPFPPVQFTFTEPPKKLVVSPRERIEMVYSRMLAPEIGLAHIREAEQQINAFTNSRGYITNIGGLGAFPTMVVDRASLSWVLSTVAHEWLHNYLALYPLGWNYFKSQDMTTMNETVAEIVGNEVGEETLRQYYPDLVEPQPLSEMLPLVEPDGFDFHDEMRRTRQEVDRLLAEGKVEEAEAYMESRRNVFVENGYPLRVLNQAYFAFHGSYGTSGASSSPIGPKLERLRELSPDLRSFLETVRRFTDPADLDAALAEMEDAAKPAAR